MVHVPFGKSGCGTLNPFKAGVADKWRKYAHILRSFPYNLSEAAQYLLDWVDGKLEVAPMLDTAACTNDTRVDPAVALAAASCDAEVIDLEPKCAKVVLGKAKGLARRPAPEHEPASKRAKGVYPLAAQLVQTHGMAWAEAIKIATRCWETSSQQEAAGVDDELRDVLHIESDHGDDADEPEVGGDDYNLFD